MSSAAERLGRKPSISRERVREFLFAVLLEVGRVPEDRIFDEATLDSDLKLESVALIEIQVAVEEEFDIEIDVIEVVEINKLGGIVDYVFSLLSRVG